MTTPTPDTIAPPQDKPEPFALDLNDDTPLPVICDLSEDGTCEACHTDREGCVCAAPSKPCEFVIYNF